MENENIIDLSKIERAYRGYTSGSLKRVSILYEGKYYLLKYPDRNKKKTHDFQVSSYINNSLSEYIGCRIFSSVGIEAQQTFLGEDKGEILVACRDFIDRENGYELQEFATISKDLYPSSDVGRYPSVEKIYDVIANSIILKGINEQAISHYWNMQVIDCLIGNFDRHTGNFGYIVHTKSGLARPSPIYDCGSSLWAKIDDQAIPTIIASAEDVEKLVYALPEGKLQLTNEGRKYSWRDLFLSGESIDCTKALLRIVPKISIEKINGIIKNTPYISDQRIELISMLVELRYRNILLPAWEKAVHKETEKIGLVYSKETDYSQETYNEEDTEWER